MYSGVISGLFMGGSLVVASVRLVWSGDSTKPSLSVPGYEKREDWSNWTFPGWSGPFVGLAVGGGLGLRLALAQDAGHLSFLDQALFSTGIGMIGGCVMWVFDAVRNRAVGGP